MTTITQTITTLPTAPDPATMTPTEFSAAAAAYVLAQKAMVPQLNTWAGQANTVAGEVNTNANAAEASATAAASIIDAVQWISGTTYALGFAVWSPIDLLTYRRKIAGAGTTDPSADATNWELVSILTPVQRFESGDVLITSAAMSSPEWLPLDGASYLRSSYSDIESEFLSPIGAFSSATSGTASNLNGVATDGSGTWIAVGNSSAATRSTDNGATWALVTTFAGDVQAIATDKAGVWVGVCGNGTGARSANDGASFSSVTLNVSGSVMRDIATDEAGVWVAVGATGKLTRSTDNGATWTLTTFPVSTDIWAVETDKNGVWIAGTNSGLVYRSSDNGATWAAVSQPSTSTSQACRGVATDGNGQWVVSCLTGVMLYSNNNGVTWVMLNYLSELAGNDLGKIRYSSGYWFAPRTATTQNIVRFNPSFPQIESIISASHGILAVHNNKIVSVSTGGAISVSATDQTLFEIPSLRVPRPFAAYIKTGESA